MVVKQSHPPNIQQPQKPYLDILRGSSGIYTYLGPFTRCFIFGEIGLVATLPKMVVCIPDQLFVSSFEGHGTWI